MSDVRQRARDALQGVSDGPWTAETQTFGDHTDGWLDGPVRGYDGEFLNPADAHFIAACRQLVPDMLALIEAQDAALRKLEGKTT